MRFQVYLTQVHFTDKYRFTYIVRGTTVKSLRPSDAYIYIFIYIHTQTHTHTHMRWEPRPSLVQIMAQYLNQCWHIVNCTIRNKLQWNFSRNSSIFIHESAFENVVCEKAAILVRPQCGIVIGKCFFLSEVNIWTVNCAQATTFIFDTRRKVHVKVSKFLKQKMSRPEGDSNPQSSDSCRML